VNEPTRRVVLILYATEFCNQDHAVKHGEAKTQELTEPMTLAATPLLSNTQSFDEKGIPSIAPSRAPVVLERC
jgi:hypothetical protein